MLPKKKIVLYSNKGTINYNQKCHPLHLGNEQYKQFPQKKFSRKRKRERKKRKRRRESENGKEKEKEKEKEEEEKMEKAVLKVLL